MGKKRTEHRSFTSFAVNQRPKKKKKNPTSLLKSFENFHCPSLFTADTRKALRTRPPHHTHIRFKKKRKKRKKSWASELVQQVFALYMDLGPNPGTTYGSTAASQD